MLVVVVIMGSFTKGLDLPGRIAPANAVSGHPNVVLIVMDSSRRTSLPLWIQAQHDAEPESSGR